MAGRKHRGFWSSFNYVTLIGGQLVALALLIVLQQFLDKSQMALWGWRVPFLIGGLLAVVAYWLRQRMQETRSFENARTQGLSAGSTRALLTQHPRETLIIFGLTAGGTMIFYVYTTYMQKFLTNTAGFSLVQATQISAAALFLFMLSQPVFGWLSDRLGRRICLGFSFLGGALATWPIMQGLQHGVSVAMAFTLVLAGMLLQSGYTSISSVVKAELFPTHVRALGVGLPYAVANAVFGGTTEYVALWFKAEGHEARFYTYASVMLVFSLLVVFLMPDTRAESRILED
jgi:MHS family alpha-ketoglutarate permease-like MFS transporter